MATERVTSPVAQLAHPRLTAVHHPLREIGEQATRLVLRLSDGRTAVTRVELATSLVVRGSTAAPSPPSPGRHVVGDEDLQR